MHQPSCPAHHFPAPCIRRPCSKNRWCHGRFSRPGTDLREALSPDARRSFGPGTLVAVGMDANKHTTAPGRWHWRACKGGRDPRPWSRGFVPTDPTSDAAARRRRATYGIVSLREIPSGRRSGLKRNPPARDFILNGIGGKFLFRNG